MEWKIKKSKKFSLEILSQEKLKKLYSSELLRENPCIPQKFLPNYNGKETPEEDEVMQNLRKYKIRANNKLKPENLEKKNIYRSNTGLEGEQQR